jgi:cyclopropane-fatty-acyl-phospholipid synthase
MSAVPGRIRSILTAADIRIGGDRPWDLQLHRGDQLWPAVISRGSLGLGEAYVAGVWDCQALDQCFTRLLLAGADRLVAGGSGWRQLLLGLRERLVNLQSLGRATQVARQHYDIAPEVYAAMLDPWWQYSCGYWERARGLEEAQQHKLAMIAAKLRLRSGMRVLDIGCGWGGLAAYLARHHGVEVTGITLSSEQLQLARRQWHRLPVRFERCDYRRLAALEQAPFDRVVSVGMFEHVGARNARHFFQIVRRSLRHDGLALVQSIGARRTTSATDGWIDAHVFPHGRLPSPTQLSGALENLFLIEDWHNFGLDYDHTLMAWHGRFEAAWSELAPALESRWNDAGAAGFRRFWRYYLLCCAAFFRSRQGQLWQLVLSPAPDTVPVVGTDAGAGLGIQPYPAETYRSVRCRGFEPQPLLPASWLSPPPER